MSWATDLDIADDFDIFDGKETILYYVFDPLTDTYADQAVSLTSLWREVAQNNMAVMHGETTTEDSVVHLKGSELEDELIRPHRLDRITRAIVYGEEETAYNYYVQDAKYQTHGNRWRLTVSKGP